MTKQVSAEDIRKFYFGSSAQSAALQPATVIPKDITPSAKHVMREAKRRLGQYTPSVGEAKLGEEVLEELVELVEQSEGEELSPRERNSVIETLSSSLRDYDVLTSLIQHPQINDIIVKSYNDISVQIGRSNVQTDLQFTDRQSYCSFVENLLKRVGKSCTTATPVVDAALDANVRACVTHESFSPQGSGPMLTLRVARHHHMSIDGLLHSELAPKPILDYLKTIIEQGDATILIAGEVGTGKTTLVRALLSAIPEDEAVLVIEDTHELMVKRKFLRTLLTREANTEGAGRITPAVAIKTGMRMAMNRLVLGEMRDPEAAESFIDACSSGHAGMSTIHSKSARDAISRLELFLARAQGNVGVATLRKQIANAVSVVVYLGLDKTERKRRIFEVLEITSAADGSVQFSPIVKFIPNNNQALWEGESGISKFGDLLRQKGVALPKPREIVSLDSNYESAEVYARS